MPNRDRYPRGSSTGGLVSIGNFYEGCNDGEFIPVYDGPNNLTGVDPVNGYAQIISPAIVSINDIGGDFGGQVGRLRPLFGRLLSFNRLQPLTPDAAISVIDAGELRRSMSLIRVPHTAWTKYTSMTQTLTITQIHAKTRVVGVIADTTALHQGPLSVVTAKVGHTMGGEEYILDWTTSQPDPCPSRRVCSTTNSEPASLVPTPYRADTSRSWSNQSAITLTLTSTAGNLSTLNAGNIDIYLTLEDMS